MPRVAVLRFPGTNCDQETAYMLREVAGVEARVVWHTEYRWRDWDATVVPGGFSYGDYGRAGLLASWSPAARQLREAAENGAPILGICNGFQVLVEAGVLPGALLPNEGGRFVARWLRVRVHSPRGPWLLHVEPGAVLDMPVAHAEGRFYHPAPGELLRSRPWLEYLENPNGSVADVAGLASEDGAVLGLMPHPERAASPLQVPRGRRPGGHPFFTSIGEALRRGW
ncbi:phosphoribosylformylglycinamidine synthase I [Pyrodictium abyssi]|uniref:Phosphoribosylformylglycinamidine synthase subunit PurQ n=1 Tax=Pyrodictium abyssi TaxID=54256 RepID=A0ABN6ZNJ5_9CREN|nr:phosphoribosylformylglycinamidine synthase I [Pyrodictium abyssi]